jgi:hypothetical protein
MLNTILDSLLGCTHRKTTFPQTRGRSAAPSGHSGRTYVVCLDCGAELGYDWNTMRVVGRVAQTTVPREAALSGAIR